MKIFEKGKFSVYIYENDHPPPHCHIRFADKSEVCIMIPLVEPMYGATISREVREAIENELNSLTQAWEQLHPQRLQAARIKSVKELKIK